MHTDVRENMHTDVGVKRVKKKSKSSLHHNNNNQELIIVHDTVEIL